MVEDGIGFQKEYLVLGTDIRIPVMVLVVVALVAVSQVYMLEGYMMKLVVCM